MQPNSNDEHRYDDIINLPHPVSATRPRMSAIDRAAQFSPFAAMTGHDAALKETARLVDTRLELDANAIDELNAKLQIAQENLAEHPRMVITYFMPDNKKFGGSYVTVDGSLKKIDEYERLIVLEDGTRIPIIEIVDIVGELFRGLE